MIPRQVREHSDIEAASPQPVHRQSMGTRLQHRMGAARAHDFGKKLLQLERFRRGCCRGEDRNRRAVRDCAEKSGCASCGMKDRIDQIARGRLAIRAGDADEFQRVSWMPEEIRGRDGQRFSRVGDLGPRNIRAERRGPRHFADDRDCAALDGRGNESISVGGFAANREERRAGRHAAAVVGERCDFAIRVEQRTLDLAACQKLTEFHALLNEYRALRCIAQSKLRASRDRCRGARRARHH